MGPSFACFFIACLFLSAPVWAIERRRDCRSKGCEERLELPEAVEALRTEGGSLRIWSENMEALRDVEIGAAEIELNQDGLVVPQYSDAPFICSVLQGSGVVGISHPLKGEFRHKNVRRIEKGDVLAVEAGVVFWLYNDGEERHRIFCVSDNSHGSSPGTYNPFPVSGARTGDRYGSILPGFSKKALADAWDVDEETVEELLRSQKDAFIVKSPRSIRFPGRGEFEVGSTNDVASSSEAASMGGFVYPAGQMYPDLLVKGGGWLKMITKLKLPLLQNIGFSVIQGRLEKDAMMAPAWLVNAHHVIRVCKGSGRMEIVNSKGERVLDTRVREGSVIVMPRFYPATKIAGSDGLEWISVLTNARPIASYMAGGNSVYKDIPAEVVAAAFGVERETEMKVRERRLGSEVIFPPRKHSQPSHTTM